MLQLLFPLFCYASHVVYGFLFRMVACSLPLLIIQVEKTRQDELYTYYVYFSFLKLHLLQYSTTTRTLPVTAVIRAFMAQDINAGN